MHNNMRNTNIESSESASHKVVKIDVSKKIFLVLFLILIVAFYYYFGCPIRFLFGLCCPGCGMTHALLSLLKLNFSAVVYYNPMVFGFLILCIVYLADKNHGKRYFYITLGVYIIVSLNVWIFRLVNHSDIVYFAPETGMIYKIFNM